ncbi:MAG: hypothetical protein ABEI52_01315, partial [Halobacteriaceae archaeon]
YYSVEKRGGNPDGMTAEPSGDLDSQSSGKQISQRTRSTNDMKLHQRYAMKFLGVSFVVVLIVGVSSDG